MAPPARCFATGRVALLGFWTLEACAGTTSFLKLSAASNDLGDLARTCDADTVRAANVKQLHPILFDLANTTFFRMFRVNLNNPRCPFWNSSSSSGQEAGTSCTAAPLPLEQKSPFGFGKFGSSPFGAPEPPAEGSCTVAPEAANGFPLGSQEGDPLDRSMTREERQLQEVRKEEAGPSCDFEEDLQTYFSDMCSGDGANTDSEDVNLMKNPERNTGYNGSHIWEAMFKENCFEVGSGLPRGRFGGDSGMCYEERVLYRLLSGWHAATTISVAKNYYVPGTKEKSSWAPNPERYMESLGRHPDRSKNLEFSFVVVLRALKKVSPFLQTYPFHTGDSHEDRRTTSLMGRLLDSQVLSVCSPLFEAFDESSLFQTKSKEQRAQLKRQFKSVFTNITVLVDCVKCQRCRLHAKLYSLGLGTALKILLTPPELIAQTIRRDEVVALVNVLWKLSDAIEDARILTELAWSQQQQQANEDSAKAMLAQQAVFDAARDKHAADALHLAEVALSTSTRTMLLDAALGAVRLMGSGGGLSTDAEETLLRSLVVQRPSDEVLLLAKHYAGTRPEMFAKIALEAVAGAPTLGGAVSLPPPGSAASPADAVVIGGGLAGMVATINLLDRGARVVLLDKQPFLGGNSGKASSGINAAVETSVESLIADTTKSAGALVRPALIERLANDSAHAVNWLRTRIAVDLSMRSQLGGHTVTRTLRPKNAFVGAEITFSAGQLLMKLAAERPQQFRLLLNTKWTALERGGAGWRATAVVNGSERVFEATNVVITSGGFGHDVTEPESLLLANRPDLDGFPTTLGPQTTGDGVKIARDIGARLVDLDRVQLHPTGFVDPKRPDERTKTLAAELLRGVGGLILDREGRRFTDELDTRQAVVNGELRATEEGRDLLPPMPPRSFWLVLNGKAAAMADRHTTLYSKKGLLTKVKGVADLAKLLGVTETQLRATYKEYNAAAEVGRDPYNRTVFPAGHWPVELDEDFYVGRIVPVIHYTMGGIAIDDEGHVLSDEDGKPIPGLYAAGEASGGVHGDNRLGGNSLLECTVFGRHIGMNMPLPDRKAVTAAATLVQVGGDSVQQAPQKAMRKITQQDLAEHNSKEQRVWVDLYGLVYDLTDYMDEHPGGVGAIKAVAGKDGTEHFEAVHNREMLESMGFKPIGERTD
mmetsp:Transcript_83198/g.240360  ORF Transcript_83198/g.240360 Transcript_83198/m.240360 type:complete len:1161 (+) Transcript_83198:103-3585(+)